MANYTYTTFPQAITISVWNVSPGTTIRFFIRFSYSSSATVLDQKYTSSGNSLTKTFPGLQESTSYTVNVGTVSGTATTWMGAQTFTTPSSSGGGGGGNEGGGSSVVRPANWSWWSYIRSGNPIAISANEWMAFCDRIDEFRAYKGLGSYGFSWVYSGTPISAWIVNQAVRAISDMSYYAPRTVSSGDTITASFFLDLQDALNRIS